MFAFDSTVIQRRWFKLLLGVVFAGAVAACSDGGSDSELPPPATGSVAGLAVSAATGAPLAGVTVASGTASTTTAADGRYSLTGVAPGAAVVTFTASGHARGFANATVAVGQTAAASARLTPIGTTQTYSAATGATITMPGTPAAVTLPPAGIVDGAGAAYAGTVTVELTPISPALDPGNMPGDMTTRIGDGTVQPIESFGAMTVTLLDAAGNRLDLASGSTATVRIPLSTRSPTPPATVPLFFFDETTGLWVEEGSATLQGAAPDQYYEGTVGHFTTWNADQVANTVAVNGCVQEADGTRVSGALVKSDGIDYSGRASAISNAEGNFSVAIRRGSTASVAAEMDGRYSNSVTVGPSEATIVLENCLALGNGTPVFFLAPQSQSVTEGGFAVFQAIARGQAPLRYQWQRNGEDIAGATTSVLLVDPVGNADDGAAYRAVATNAAGSTHSEAATLTVASLPPVIAVPPAALSVVAGQPASFMVQMLPQGAPLAYQWLRNGTPIDGATQQSYTLAAAQLADSGASFAVRVSNAVAEVTSAAATLTVTVAPVNVSITSHPASTSVYVGQSAQFAVQATGSAPLTYQWRRDGQPIAGATAASYTINPTALADNGAVFSVVVSNATGSSTSTDAVLTVTEPPAVAGYYMVAQAGAQADGAIVFANGSQTFRSAALVAVNSTDPGAGVVTVEVAGAAQPLFEPLPQTQFDGTQISNTQQRYTFYLKNSRLYRLDHVSDNGAPTGQVVSALTTGDMCGDGGFIYEPNGLGSLVDLADVTHSWVVLRGPGTDGQCSNADDEFLGVRADMTGTDAAVRFNGTPQVEVWAGNGALAGVIVLDGMNLRRLDANLGNPTTVHTLVTGLSNEESDFVFGAGLPGNWIFRDGDKIHGYRLDGSLGAPALLATLSAQEQTGHIEMTAQGSDAYLAISNGSSSRILRVANDLAVTTVATNGPGEFYDIQATPTRLVFQNQSTLLSMPRTGGDLITLFSTQSMQYLGRVLVAGENVYYETTTYGTGSEFEQAVGIVDSDGGNAQSLPGHAILGALLAPSVDVFGAFNEDVHALILAQGASVDGQHAGSTLKAILGSNRSTLVTYGTLPAEPTPLYVYPAAFAPLHYGQPGLMTLMSFAMEDELTDLMYFDSDSAGLLRLTNNIGVVAPSRAVGLRPLAVRTTPSWLVTRTGLLHAVPAAAARTTQR